MGEPSFTLNGVSCSLAGVAPTTTLLRYLRDQRGLTGTKEGCAEGDCGACTVAVLEEIDGRGEWRSMCSCLLLLPMLAGKQVRTVEGIGDARAPHVAQAALAQALGSQCGYCTPGVTMSLFEACYREDLDEPWKLEAQLCGNLCRCTGYRPIREAAEQVAARCPADQYREACAHPAPRAAFEHRSGEQRYAAPGSFPELFALLAEPGARVVAGGTDLALEVTKRHAAPPFLVSLEALPLRALEETSRGFVLGAGVDLSTLERFAAGRLPPLQRMLRYFGSRQIKNRATVGGNLCTASPIGDLAPVFLALNGVVRLLGPRGERRVPLDDFFLGYRRTALAPGEILAAVELPRLTPAVRAAAYKVSKRRELDISTVSAAFAVRLEEERVVEARLAFGGMAATPARARRAEAALVGRPWSEDQVRAALAELSHDFRPISDHRGSAWYRAALAENLLFGFFHETRREPWPGLAPGHVATVEVGR